MKNSPRWLTALILIPLLAASAALSGCGSSNLEGDDFEDDSLAAESPEESVEILEDENPHKHLPMDFASASQSARESRTFPGAFRIAADALEIGRGASGNIPNIGAEGEAYLEMPHPDGTQLHIRGNRIRANDGTVTVSGWPVVVREGKRLVGTTKDSVIQIGSNGVQALGPSTIEDLVSGGASFASDDSTDPLPEIDSSTNPFIPLPPDFDIEANPEITETKIPESGSGVGSIATTGKRGIIDGKPVGKEPKRGFTGEFEGTENPKIPGDPSLNNPTPAEVSTDFGIGNTPPIPTPGD